MSDCYMSIPYAVDLTDSMAWENLDDDCKVFAVVRMHFKLVHDYSYYKIKKGEVLCAVQVPDNVDVTHEFLQKREVDLTDCRKSISKCIKQNEVMSGIATELSAGVGVKCSLGGNVGARIRHSFSTQNLRENIVHIRDEMSFKVISRFRGDDTSSYLFIKTYNVSRYYLYLTCVDHLTIEYSASGLRLRKRANAKPKISGSKHVNIVKYGECLGSVYVDNPLPGAGKLLLESKYTGSEYEDIRFSEDSGGDVMTHHTELPPKIPTLYHIARAAFPRRWIMSKHAKQKWTDEELMKLEIEEFQERIRRG